MPHTAENEIFPRRLQRAGAGRQAHRHRAGNGRPFQRHPQHAEIIRIEAEQAGAQHELEHRVIHPPAAQAQRLEARRDETEIGGRGAQPDKASERAEQHAEPVSMHQPHARIDKHAKREQKCHAAQEQIRHRALLRRTEKAQRQSGEERQQGSGQGKIQLPRLSIVLEAGEVERVEMLAQAEQKQAGHEKANSTRRATENSATNGMPGMPVAASTSPFSVERKPITCATALRRIAMSRKPSSTTDKEMARSSRRERDLVERGRQHHQHGNADQGQAQDHRQADRHHVLDRADQVEMQHHVPQADRQGHGLDRQT